MLKRQKGKSVEEPTRMSLVGTRAAGKSTVIGLLDLTALDMAMDSRSKDLSPETRLVSASIDEMTSNVRATVDNLRNLRFPQPTPSDQSFLSKLGLEYQRKRPGRRAKSFQAELTITDVAGETIGQLMESIEAGEYALNQSLNGIQEINKYILSSNSFIIVVDTENLLRSSKSNPGPDFYDTQQDVAIARFIDCLKRWKSYNAQSKKIQSVALIGTKYDRCREMLGLGRQYGDLEGDFESRRRFMVNYLPQCWTSLESLFPVKEQSDRIRVFHSEVAVDDNEDYEEPRIFQEEGWLRPKYSFDQYQKIIGWIGETSER